MNDFLQAMEDRLKSEQAQRDLEDEQKAEEKGPALVELIRDKTDLFAKYLPANPQFEVVRLDEKVGGTPNGHVAIVLPFEKEGSGDCWLMLTFYRASDAWRWAVMPFNGRLAVVSSETYRTAVAQQDRAENDLLLFKLLRNPAWVRRHADRD